MVLVGLVSETARSTIEKVLHLALIGLRGDGALLKEFGEPCCFLPGLSDIIPVFRQLLCQWDHKFVAFQDLKLFCYMTLL